MHIGRRLVRISAAPAEDALSPAPPAEVAASSGWPPVPASLPPLPPAWAAAACCWRGSTSVVLRVVWSM